MRPILYDASETAFDTNGIGVLSDAISCVPKATLNGQYELTLKYPVTGIHFADIAQRSIILAKPDPDTESQPFRIYRITKPTFGVVTVYARHIAYDLMGIPVAPFTASSVSHALVQMKNNAVTDCPFSFYTDKSTAANMAVSVPTPIWALLGGSEGSILDTYGGEYEFDRRNVKLLNRRGADRGVTIRYGKNLTTLEQDENCANCYTGVYPYWANTDGTELVQLPEKILDAPGTYNYVRVLTLDLSEEWEEAPTEEQLRAKAQSYMAANDIGVPAVSWKIEFVQLEQTEEYQHLGRLEQVVMGDTVSVYFPDMGIEASARVVEMEYDSILERYKSVTLGSVKANLATTIAAQNKEIEKKPSLSITERIATALAKAMTGAKGGCVRLLDTDGDDMPDELYVGDNADPAKAKRVWRGNYEGIAVSKTGYNGPFIMGATVDDGIMSWMVTAAQLVAGTITSADEGKTFFLDLDNGILKMQATELSIAGKTAATTDGTIVSTVEEFYLSTSPTALAGGSWSNTAPTWKDGYYIWRRTLATYGDGSTEYTPSEAGVCITGNSGNGVQSITNYYQVGSSGTTPPAGTWSTTVPTLTESARYLWNYEVIHYSGGTDMETDPCVIGVYGTDGTDGKGIGSITEYYVRSTSNTTAPTSGWQTSVPTLTTTYRYLWNYEIITYTDSTTYTSAKRVIGVYGDTGDNGVGIESVEVQYYLSTSSTTVTGGSWGTSVPTIPEGYYLWTRNKITYTDNGEVNYTGAYCLSKAMEDVVDTVVNQEKILAELMANNPDPGLYSKDGVVYLNANAVKTGSLSAEYISLNGLFSAYSKNGYLGGYIGYGEGDAAVGIPMDGIALYNRNYSCYVIATTAGTRMQAGDYSFYITPDKPALMADFGNGNDEYINPPMNVGVAYETVYRYKGKRVYAMLINFGSVPNATAKRVTRTFSSAYTIVDSAAVMRAGTATMKLAYSGNTIGYFFEHGTSYINICIVTTEDFSAYTAEVTLWYVKD